MTLDITLPGLPGGAATLLRWLVGEGEWIVEGAPLLLVVTERAEVLLPAPGSGRLQGRAAVGAVAEPGEVLGRLATAEGGPQKADVVAHEASAQQRLLATPLARAIAREHGVEIDAIAGSGAGGRVAARDVWAHLEQQGSAVDEPAVGRRPLAETSAPPVAAGDVAGARFRIPIATATVEFDASAALGQVATSRAAFARLRLPLGLAAHVVSAVAALLPRYPLLNASWREDGIALRRRLHIAAGEAAGGVAPLRWALVRDAGDLALRGIARALAQASEPAGATFAVVSMAEGASWQSGAPPLEGTTAALSVGAPTRRAVIAGEALAMRPTATLTLSYDARAVDHSLAAAFLIALSVSLEREAKGSSHSLQPLSGARRL